MVVVGVPSGTTRLASRFDWSDAVGQLTQHHHVHRLIRAGVRLPHGKRFRIHAVLSRWCEAGGWWNRISDGKYRPDDQARAVWRVEAAPIGALTTFELERDEVTGQWIIRNV